MSFFYLLDCKRITTYYNDINNNQRCVLMDDNNRYSTLDNIYKALIFMTFAVPTLCFYIAFQSYILAIALLLLFIIIPHALIWTKYYKFIDHNNFQGHIKKILKAFWISSGILVISLLPMLVFVGADGGQPTGGEYLMMFLAAIGCFIGPAFAWSYYGYKLMKNYSLLNIQIRGEM